MTVQTMALAANEMRTFATAPGDAVGNLYGGPAAGVLLTVWTAREQGTQVTDLYDLDGDPLPGHLVTDERGVFAFKASHTFSVLWVRTPEGAAYGCVAAEVQEKAATAADGFAAVQSAAATAGAKADAAKITAQTATVTANAATGVAQSAIAQAAEAAAAAGAGQWGMTTAAPVIPKLQAYESWPSIVVADDGSWLIAHASGPAHAPASGRHGIVRRSLDRGITWTTVRDLSHATRNVGANTMIKLRSGRVLLMSDQSEGVDDVRTIECWKSDDHGVTWALLSTITVASPKLATLGEAFETASGAIVVGWHGAGWGVMRSTDGGLTWTRIGVTNGGMWGFEMRICQSPDGPLIGLGRQGSSSTAGISQHVSYDDGVTWQVATNTNLAPNGQSATPSIIADGYRAVVVWHNRVLGTLNRAEGNLAEVIDNPLAWGPSEVIGTTWADQIGNHGYPDLDRTPQGDHVLTWYSGATRTAVQTALITRSAGAVAAASRRPIRLAGMVTAASDKTTTGTGTSLMKGQLLIDDMGQMGKVWIRILGCVRHSVASGKVRVYLQARGQGILADTGDVTCNATPAIETEVDTGWVQVSAGWNTGSADPAWKSLVYCRVSAVTAGTATLLEGSTMQIGLSA